MRRALFFAIFGIAVFLLSVDSIIGYVSDFLIEEITSNFGISLFVLISAVFIIASFVIFQLIKCTTSEVRNNSKELRVLHGAAFTTQLLLIAAVTALLIQIVFLSEYYTAFPITIAALSPLTAAFVMIMSCSILITWFRFNRGSYVVLIFALAFSINAYVFIYTSFASIYHLIEKDTVITPESEVIYPTDLFQAGSIQRILSDTYKFAATANFVMLLAGVQLSCFVTILLKLVESSSG